MSSGRPPAATHACATASGVPDGAVTCRAGLGGGGAATAGFGAAGGRGPPSSVARFVGGANSSPLSRPSVAGAWHVLAAHCGSAVPGSASPRESGIVRGLDNLGLAALDDDLALDRRVFEVLRQQPRRGTQILELGRTHVGLCPLDVHGPVHELEILEDRMRARQRLDEQGVGGGDDLLTVAVGVRDELVVRLQEPGPQRLERRFAEVLAQAADVT